MRIAGILLPFFTESQLVNSTASMKFVADSMADVAPGDCVLCYQNECQNGGTCEDPVEQFDCACPDGFEGPTCAANIDECLDSRCVNGVCLDAVANYTCSCLAGWTGWLCDEDLDECLSQPCLNGGFCQQTLEPGNYSCSCMEEYEGHNCEELKIKTCEQQPCRNGGSCRPGSRPWSDDLYTCDCTTGFKVTYILCQALRS